MDGVVELGLKDSSRNFIWGCGMSFVSYPHLILLTSGQTFKVTVALKKFCELLFVRTFWHVR